jgi:hypothetical protein
MAFADGELKRKTLALACVGHLRADFDTIRLGTCPDGALSFSKLFPDDVSKAGSDKTADNGSRGWCAHRCTYNSSCAESNGTTVPGAQ